MKLRNPFLEAYDLEEYQHPYRHALRDFPFIIDVEPTNFCNLDCLMCAKQVMKRKKGKMPFNTFKKVADEAAEEGCKGLRFIRFGEPLLNEKIFEMVSYAKGKGLLTHLTTNGLLLGNSKIEKVFDSGLDSIIFSFQGTTKEEYALMRNNNQYETLKANINKLVDKRKELGAIKPFIQITTTVLDETEEQIKAFYKTWQGLVDRVDHWYTSLERLEGIKRAKPFFEMQKAKEMQMKREKNTARNMKCNEVMTKLSVNWDGTVTACCGDYDNFMKVGNIEENTLKEIWHNKKINSYRKILGKGKRNKIPFCSKCTSKF